MLAVLLSQYEYRDSQIRRVRYQMLLLVVVLKTTRDEELGRQCLHSANAKSCHRAKIRYLQHFTRVKYYY